MRTGGDGAVNSGAIFMPSVGGLQHSPPMTTCHLAASTATNISLMAVQERKLPSTIKPMLGRLVRGSFDSPKHIFEVKWDALRALAFIEDGELKILSRNGRNITSQFPELAEMPSQVK